jgi:glycosyltransferase involved in cell wall biosynthesis
MKPELSVVTPAFNEERSMHKFHQAVRSALRNESAVVEIVIVDDGSTDGTAERVREIQRHDPLVRMVRLTRNFGNQPALLAGIHSAQGKGIITMDCDLQHPPEELPRLIAAWRAGAKVVQMVRRSNPDATLLDRATSWMFDWVLRRLTRLPLIPGAGDFRLLDAQIAKLILRIRHPVRQAPSTMPGRHHGAFSAAAPGCAVVGLDRRVSVACLCRSRVHCLPLGPLGRRLPHNHFHRGFPGRGATDLHRSDG